MFKGFSRVFFFCIVALSFASICAASDCSIEKFFEETLHPKRSQWKMEQANEFHIPPFDKYRFPEVKRLVKIHEGSIAAKDPEILKILEDVDALQLDANDFVRQYKDLHKSKPPQRDAYIKFYDSRYRLYHSSMNEFLARLIKADPPREKFWTHVVRTQNNRVNFAYKSAKGEARDSHFERAWMQFHLSTTGSMGELQAAMALPHVVGSSVHLDQIWNQKIAERMRLLTEECKKDPFAVRRFYEKFPQIANNRRLVNDSLMRGSDNQSWSSKIEMLSEWLKSKEIDVVRKESGKIHWVEVKKTHDKLVRSSFFRSDSGKKSYADQILENKQVIEFLGLQNEVKLEYLATHGVDFTVAKFLEENGITLLKND